MSAGNISASVIKMELSILGVRDTTCLHAISLLSSGSLRLDFLIPIDFLSPNSRDLFYWG